MSAERVEKTPPRADLSRTAVTLRRAVNADLPAVVEIERRSFSDPWSTASFRSALDAEGVLFDVAQSAAGEVLGYVVAWCAVDEAELANLAVAAEARGAGVGKALLDAALKYAAERGCVCMFLEVRESIAAARSIYVSRGFEEVGRRRRYYREPVEDALIMRAAMRDGGDRGD